MNRLHWRKLRREMWRIVLQVLRLPAEIFKLIAVRRWYDLVLSRAIKRTAGGVTLGNEAGIYLIFPNNGILGSHLTALKEMVQAGITPIVVSNLPLSDADRKKLAPYTSVVIERPNVGYDFGGYRDGIIELCPILTKLDKLWLLNDSVWFVPQQTSWFNKARNLNRDFVAATSNYAMPRVDPCDFRDIVWNYNTDHKNFHYASYALGFSSRLLQDRDFIRFWKNLNISNDKTRTVRRGEIGLSQWIKKHGYTHGATYEVSALDKELQYCSDEEIDRIAHELVIPDDDALEAVQSAVIQTDAATTKGRSERICLILTAVSRRASAYALPAYSIPQGFHFLKKSPLWLSPGGAQITLNLIERLDGPIGREIKHEATLLQRFTPQ